MKIEVTVSGEKAYIRTQIPTAWKELQKVQKGSKQRRESHMEILADYYTIERKTTTSIEILKIKLS